MKAFVRKHFLHLNMEIILWWIDISLNTPLFSYPICTDPQMKLLYHCLSYGLGAFQADYHGQLSTSKSETLLRAYNIAEVSFETVIGKVHKQFNSLWDHNVTLTWIVDIIVSLLATTPVLATEFFFSWSLACRIQEWQQVHHHAFWKLRVKSANDFSSPNSRQSSWIRRISILAIGKKERSMSYNRGDSAKGHGGQVTGKISDKYVHWYQQPSTPAHSIVRAKSFTPLYSCRVQTYRAAQQKVWAN